MAACCRSRLRRGWHSSRFEPSRGGVPEKAAGQGATNALTDLTTIDLQESTMASGNSTTSVDKGPELSVYKWGECRRGTAEQLRASGFATDQPLPGEEGGNKRRSTITD